MKNILLTLIVAVLASLLTLHFAGKSTISGSPEAQTAPKQDVVFNRILESKTIRCGYLTWPPLQQKDLKTGQLTGPLTDYIVALGKVLDLRIDWSQELNLSTYMADLNTNRYDIECSGGWPNSQRGKKIDYAKPVFYIAYKVYVHKDSPLQNLEELNSENLTAAIMDAENSAATRSLIFPKTKTFEIPNSGQVSDLIMAVSLKKADFTIVNTTSAELFKKNNPDKIRALEPAVKLIPMSISFARNEPSLKNMMNIATDQLILSGEIDRILDKYDPEHKLYVRINKPYDIER